MANSNFVVHNGLTVGPLTIDAATGAISTTGAITTTGASPRISQDASNVIVTTINQHRLRSVNASYGIKL